MGERTGAVTPERWQQVERVYVAALAADAGARAALVDELCAGDGALRSEVISLLEQAGGTETRLSVPAIDVALRGMAAHPYSLLAGTAIGVYRIVEPLGAGGMGHVYRALDTHLGRDVAIKILPPHFTADAERRARLAREARLLAALNHPHIGAIYGLEEADGLTALVLELVEGPTLGDRLHRGPLPIADALVIARQVAEALDAAHERGIVHRDLKPENIVLQGAGASHGEVRAKVLDFGVAKTMVTRMDEDPISGRSSPPDPTAEGAIVGTPTYMSPEQARGGHVDKRTDIWAFGCVLFEMLTARRPFEGDTTTDTLARILEREPDWTALPAETPAAIRTLLERCLRKDPHKRLHDIADARIELDDGVTPTAFPGASAGESPHAPHRGRGPLIWTLVGVLAVASGGVALLSRRYMQPPEPERIEFPIAPAAGSRFYGTLPEFAISPDGRRVAFVAFGDNGPMLWVQSLAAPEPRALIGTERARNPFWSPDSESLGYFADGRMKTITVNGGSPVVVCPVAGTTQPLGPAGTWNSRDVILFSDRLVGLLRVDVKGGDPTAVTKVPGVDSYHLWPSFLPDGEHFLYLAQSGGTSEMRVGSLTPADPVTLGPAESHAVYAAGHLFFVRGGNLIAQPFDADARQLIGDPVQLGAQTGVDSGWHRGMLSVSTSGRIVYRPTARTPSQLTWVDRHGRSVRSVGNPGLNADNIDLSRDDRQVAVSQVTETPGAPGQFDVWVIDVTTGRATRLTDDSAQEFDPAWSPDGAQVAFNSNRPGTGHPYGLFRHASNGGGEDVPLVNAVDGFNIEAPDWSRNGIIVFTSNSGPRSGTGADLWTVAASGERKPAVFLSTKHQEGGGTFSPDGRWIAYQSDASGRTEVYVRPFPAREPLHAISVNGGASPRWGGDGKEVFFLAPDGAMMAARFDTATGLTAGVPVRLFPTPLEPGTNRAYAVAGDGQQFLIPMAVSLPLRVVLDWRAMLPK